jgi:hypothetical protein
MLHTLPGMEMDCVSNLILKAMCLNEVTNGVINSEEIFKRSIHTHFSHIIILGTDMLFTAARP